jgi:hypothetical protein
MGSIKLSSQKYCVSEEVLKFTGEKHRDVLEFREHIGTPLANDIRRWLSEQPRWQLCHLDFNGIRAITSSVAEEVGPLLLKAMEQLPTLEHKYPIYWLKSPEPAYTVARAFANFNLNCLALLTGPTESTDFGFIVAKEDSITIGILGQLTKQMEQILLFADQQTAKGKCLTSEGLANLKFLTDVKPAARSKRLTELYSRRLLAFRENPSNPKERIFIPAWRLESDEQCFTAQQLF